MNRTAAPRYPSWFSHSDGKLETYPLRFPTLEKFDQFQIAASRRRWDVPYADYLRVGVNILDGPSFGEPPFYDYHANPRSFYTIPNGQAWLAYLNRDDVKLTADDLSADNPSLKAITAINYMADNLEDITNDLILDQRSESGVLDITKGYYRIAQRVAQRITAQVQAGNLPFRPIYAGGYIFFSNSDPFFWQYDLDGSVYTNKERPLRHEHFYDGSGWMEYNHFYQQQRFAFMDSNSGTYWQGPNMTDGLYEFLNGLFFRVHARNQMPSAYRNSSRHTVFTWDKCDNQRGSKSTKLEWKTTNPAGRLKVNKRVNPPREWLRAAGFFAATCHDGFAVWNEPTPNVADPNWTEGNIDTNYATAFYPASGGGPIAYPKQINTQQMPANNAEPQGLIDYAMVGVRQGYEVRRALGGRCARIEFMDHKLGNGVYIPARPNGSDALYAADENRGVFGRLHGQNGYACDFYLNAYGDFIPHTATYRSSGTTATDTMPVFGTGLSYSEPFLLGQAQ
ncbi:hypothetical protein A6C57_00375 [Fibrella sp. ES10-3-2-2]|nr:hypothetical protein A6C57_00375 [Fibrella sp. ES10-3-2-2]